MLNEIAQYDIHEKIQKIQEFYWDYYVINSNVFHLNIESCIPNFTKEKEGKFTKLDQLLFNRIYDGLISICLSNRILPTIKCVQGSSICLKLSQKVAKFFEDKDEFTKKECGREQNGLLFLFDRKEDPVTPLINQWTYQAMLHEIIGIKNNVVAIKGGKEEQFVLSDIGENDKFFSIEMNNDYGSVANDVQEAADKLKMENSEMEKETSIEQLRKIIDSLPEKKKESIAITKHYKLFYELSEYVSKHKLMELSPIEQDIACNNNKKEQLNKIAEILKDEKVASLDKAKLYLLYVFRYEGDSSVEMLKNLMIENNLRDWIQYGDLLLKYAGKKERVLDVLSNKDFLSKSRKMFLNAFGSKNNVFMQHVSYLNDLIDKVIRGKMRDNVITTVNRSNNFEIKLNKVIVFVFGGITFEETKDLTVLGKQLGVQIISGGTNILNSKSFFAELKMLNSQTNEDISLNVS